MLINMAYAADPSTAPVQSSLFSFLPLIALFVLFYFLLLRPQMKRAKEQRNMLASLQKGDEIVTAGGLCGKITKVGENFASIEITEGTVVQVQKATIQTLLPKGSLRKLD